MLLYNEITPADYSPENYIMIMNDPTREYYKVYEIQNYRNAQEGINWIYLNLPNDVIKKAALASIKNNEAMYASCDVGKQFQRETGILDPEMYDYESLFIMCQFFDISVFIFETPGKFVGRFSQTECQYTVYLF